MHIVNPDGSQVGHAELLKRQFAGQSIYDCLCLGLVQTTAKAMLLTGYGHLRARAAKRGVEVHCELWMSNEIETWQVMADSALAEALERLQADPLVISLADEVVARIARLRRKAQIR